MSTKIGWTIVYRIFIMKKNISTFIFFFFLAVSFSYAQKGKVAGTVMDGEFVEPMAFANILVKGTTTGTTSDFDGKYELELEPGTYTLIFSFVGYDTQEISEIVIKSNEITVIDVTLSTNSLETVVVTTTVKRNTENAVLNMQKKSVTLLDGLSAQSIKSSGASSVATAVKSVPGVSIQGGKYVYVRGLGDRYTKSILNGVDIPGLDPDRNTIQMDLFPTSILDNVIVLKSASAEYPADFTGGVVDIITKDFPNKFESSISLGMGYNPDMHFNDKYLTYTGSDTDFFGYDDGTRNLPINRYQPIPGTFENRLLLTSLTDKFNKELAAKQENSGMNFDLGFTLGDQYDLGNDMKLGYQTSFSYKNETTFYEERIDGAWIRQNGDPSEYQLNSTLSSRGSEGINNIILNGLAGVSLKTKKSKYKFNALHIQNGESTAGVYNQEISEDGTGGAQAPIYKNALTYTERSVTNFLLSGSHRFSNDENAWNLDWKLSPTFSKVYDKDHRITPLRPSDNNTFVISPSTATYPIRIWRWLQEENWVGKIDLKKKYNLFNSPAQLKFGGSYVYKFRDFSIDAFTFQITGDDSFIENGNVDNLLATQNIWTPDSDSGTHITFGDTFNPDNAYEGEHNIASTYISNEFNITEKFKTVLGLRTEYFKAYYTGADTQEDIVYEREEVQDKFDFFPSANLIYSLNDNVNLRASYYRTTARPSFKEQSNSQIYDPITNRLFIGDLDLVPSYINNFDLRYERYGDSGQMFAISGFYKDFKDPIEITFFESAANQLTPANLGNATVIGGEFEFRQRLGFILESLNDLKFNANVSVISSKLEMSQQEYNRRVLAAREGESIDRERDLQGQSPFLLNIGLDYNNEDIGLQTGLFYNVQGKTLEVVGTGIVPDVYTQPFNSLNFTLNKAFGETKNSSIELKISNLLNDKKESLSESFRADDQIFSLRDPGIEFSLGYSFKF
ncbi:TonB-dependent receptor [Meridianimaribacter flavus]|uniref:TonB-dependent receptor n=2 Tax=Flavobacteriales TaxID=200644 RepID=A0ABY2G3L9_9FLAO|nr:TonB-dependent receptor [Meridianimaribacter flavus]